GVLAVQAHRTPAEIAAAQADRLHSVFRYADVFGASFTPTQLPRTAAFFERVVAYDKGEVKAVKAFWHHPRPVLVSHAVHPLSQEQPDDWSYPSGHSTLGYTEAVLLANMVPERRAAIFARADRYAQHRIVMGVHYPSDVAAGRWTIPPGRRTTRRRAPSCARRWHSRPRRPSPRPADAVRMNDRPAGGSPPPAGSAIIGRCPASSASPAFPSSPSWH